MFNVAIVQLNQGPHPLEFGTEVDMTVCFDGGAKGTCIKKSVSITVTRCSDYYVYYLNTVPQPLQRYCATSHKDTGLYHIVLYYGFMPYKRSQKNVSHSL